MTKGKIFNIQKFSLHDGPGIRTTVFFKGCPLKCKWCANPESQAFHSQVLYDQNKCISCLSCIKHCEKDAITFTNHQIQINHHLCTACRQCVINCPTKSLSMEGDDKDVDEIVDICLQDLEFYLESNGGVTISGGEGMAQPDFLKDLALKLKQHHLHLAIETTGYVKKEIFQSLSDLFDLILFDVKHFDCLKHQEGTGVKNTLILENLEWLIQQPIECLCRIPVIPNFNDSISDAYGFVELFKKLNITSCQLLCFHQLGEKKYNLLGQDYDYKNKKALHQEDLLQYQKIFLDAGINCFF